MDKSIIENLEAIVGKNHIVTDREQMQNYLVDESPELARPKPASDVVLVRPASAEEISAIMSVANKYNVPVFPRGGGTGLVGGAVPTKNGIVISMERMNKIEIDNDNLMAVAEAGVTLETLLKMAGDTGLFFPLHPGDESAQLGGLAVTNAGGARAIRYGVMRNYVRGMEIVLPTGEILRLGGKLHKDNVGYDLMQLIMGSEGTLAIITKVILRLHSKFGSTATLILPYTNRHSAIASVPKILRQAGFPLAIEYVEKDLMEKTAEHLGETWPVKSGSCYLIIVMAESDRDHVLAESLKVAEICKQNGSLEPLFLEQKNEQDKILRIRSNIYVALKNQTADILDLTVPAMKLANLIDRTEEIAKREQIYLPTYGHAADGNLHVHIMKGPNVDSEYVERLRGQLYELAIRSGGVISGEHGIGKARTEKLSLYLDRKEIELMKKIKQVFDPNNILNPGTKIPD